MLQSDEKKNYNHFYPDSKQFFSKIVHSHHYVTGTKKMAKNN